MIEPVAPDLARQLNGFGPEMIAAISEGAAETDSGAELQRRLGRRALVAYAERLAAHHGHELAAADLRELEPVAEDNGASLDTAPGRQRAFGEVASFLRGRFSWAEDPDAEAECRGVALQESGLDAFGQPALPAAPSETPAALPTSDDPRRGDGPAAADTKERYLDSEIVAIYW